ncbi:MAG TPA: glycine C-acetyltransferase, partial [Propionibacteriaceae bacterium]|nr:glycine C-acetyltransferase [Propionibacteriaceae bacterium]
MFGFDTELAGELEQLRTDGLYKAEGRLETPQSRTITVAGRELVNLCANNYLGLADHPAIIAAAHEGLDRWGFGMASVRFI